MNFINTNNVRMQMLLAITAANCHRSNKMHGSLRCFGAGYQHGRPKRTTIGQGGSKPPWHVRIRNKRQKNKRVRQARKLQRSSQQ